MNCFECAKANDTVPAVAICEHCGVGLCLDHLIDARRFSVAGTHEGCGHRIPAASPLGGISGSIVESARRHGAEIA